MLGDVLRIVDVLGRKGVELVLRGGADPAVSINVFICASAVDIAEAVA